jgi:hypothetical protein
MIKPDYIKRFDVGGVIDTDSMLSDVKKDPRFFKDGAYTKSGRMRLAAIQEISDTQKAGKTYEFNDPGTEFKIVDKSKKIAESDSGHGVEVGKKAGIFYGVFNNEKRSKKEVSKALSDRKYIQKEEPDKGKTGENLLANTAKKKIIKSIYDDGYTSVADIVKYADGYLKPEEVEFHLKTIVPKVVPKTEKTVKKEESSSPSIKVDNTTPSQVNNSVTNSEANNASTTSVVQDNTALSAAENTTPKTVTNTTKVTTTEPKKPEINKDKASEFNYQQSLAQNSVVQTIFGREINDHIKKTDPINILNAAMNDQKLYDSQGVINLDLINKKIDDIYNVPEVQKLNSKLNNSKVYGEDWSISQRDLLDKRLKQVQSLKLKINEAAKTRPLSKDVLKALSVSFQPVPKGQSGLILGQNDLSTTDNSWEKLNKLKDSFTKYGSYDEQDELDLDEEDKAEWEAIKKVSAPQKQYANTGVVPLEVKNMIQKINKNIEPLADFFNPLSNNEIGTKNEQVISEKNKLIKEQTQANTKKALNSSLRFLNGLVQPNDIAQFLLARETYKNKVAEVPVNLLKYTSMGHRNVLAPRDMDYAMIKGTKERINQIDSGYRGSDPVIDAIMKQSAQGTKAALDVEQKMKRAEYRRIEEDRASGETEQARQQAAQDLANATNTYNTNNDRIREGNLQAAQNEQINKANWYKNLSTILSGMQTRVNERGAVNKQMEYEISTNENNNKIAVVKDDYDDAKAALAEAIVSNRSGLKAQIDLKPLEAALIEKKKAYTAVAGNTGNFIRSEMNRIGL